MADDTRTGAPRRRWGDVRSRSIWRWQLILSACVVTLIVAIAVLDPSRFGRPSFFAGAVLLVVTTCGALLFPWHRVGQPTVALLPAVDIVVIGLMSAGGGAQLRYLWVLPIAWVATYYTLPWLIASVGLVAAALVADALGDTVTAAEAQRFFTVLLSLAFLGVTIHVGARRTRAYGLLLRRQFAQLDRTRRRAELQAQRTALLSNTLDTGLARIDRDGVMMDANTAFLRLFAAESIAGFTSTNVVEYDGFRGSALALERTALVRAARGERFDEKRVWLFTPDARWRALELSTRPVQAMHGEPASNLIIVHDVTAVLEAERARQTVTTVVSHELRNPLTAILGHTDLLQDRPDLPADVRRPLAVIDNAAQRMQRLITSTLDRFTDAGSGASDDVDLSRVVGASVEAFSPAATTSQVRITMRLEPDLLVTGDAFRLRQAVDNIVGNAVKYTTRGGRVTVTAAHEGTDVVVTVADTGIGMSEADRVRMFEPGFRSETARSSGIGGTGLGMGIVREIVDEHGGGVDVRSTLGRGTTARIVLPLRTPEVRTPEEETT